MGKAGQPTWNATAGLFVVSGSFDTKSSGNPATVYGEGFSVVRDSTGTYTITFNDKKCAALHSFHCDLQRPSFDGYEASFGPYTAPSSSAYGSIKAYTGLSAAQTAGVKATGTISCTAQANYIDGEQMAVIKDGHGQTYIFECDASGDGLSSPESSGVGATGTVTCDAQTNYTDTEIMAVVKDGLGNTYTFECDKAGDGVTAGNIAVDISGDTTNEDVATTLEAAMTGDAGFAQTFTISRATAVITLTNKVKGVAGNITITETSAAGAHSVSGMSGGVDVLVVENQVSVAVDISGDSTKEDVAATLQAAIAASALNDIITSVDNVDGTISLTHQDVGAIGNETITENVADVNHTVAGMASGVDAGVTALALADPTNNANSRIHFRAEFQQYSKFV